MERQNSYQKEQQNSSTAEHHSKNPYLDMNIPEEFDPHNEELEKLEDSRAVIVITLVLLILGWIPIFGLFFLTYFTASSLEDMEPGEGNIEINIDRNN